MNAEQRLVRDKAIMREVRAGKSTRFIATKFNLTNARIQQIMERETKRRRRKR